MLPELSMTNKNEGVALLIRLSVSLHANTVGEMPTTVLGTTIVSLLKDCGQAEKVMTHRSAEKDSEQTTTTRKIQQRFPIIISLLL